MLDSKFHEAIYQNVLSTAKEINKGEVMKVDIVEHPLGFPCIYWLEDDHIAEFQTKPIYYTYEEYLDWIRS